MQVLVERWGGALAIRLPASLVNELGLKEGDQIELVKDDGLSSVSCLPRSDQVLSGLRIFRGTLPATERMGRDDASSR
jgi:antitoxin MazE